MGFLRKVGRKVKKKLNKVFGQKVGGILGMVGLYFAMGAVAKGLSGWAKSTFGAGKSTADAAALTQKVSDTAQATLDAKSAADSTAVITEAAKKGVDATVATTGVDVETLIAESKSNVDAFNSWVGGQESLLNQGKLPTTVNPSLTDTVIENVSNPDVFKQTAADVAANLDIKVDFGDISKEAMSGIDYNAGALERTKASLDVAKTAQESATGFQKFAADPVGSTVDYVGTKAKEAGDYIKGDFVPDLAQGALTGAVNRSLMEEEEVMGFGRPAQSQPMMTAAQGNHLAAVQAQPGYANLTNMRSFTDLANQTLYGTGSPSYLQNVYQPIKI
jgi:hypothetical protein